MSSETLTVLLSTVHTTTLLNRASDIRYQTSALNSMLPCMKNDILLCRCFGLTCQRLESSKVSFKRFKLVCYKMNWKIVLLRFYSYRVNLIPCLKTHILALAHFHTGVLTPTARNCIQYLSTAILRAELVLDIVVSKCCGLLNIRYSDRSLLHSRGALC